MRPPGPLVASGRDSDIFEYGPGLVLRRSRDRRSMAEEARTMGYLHEQGYPVPAVVEISDDGAELVLERIDGPSMVQALTRAPWSVRQHARTLAELHLQLHDLSPPDFLAPAPVGRGDRLLHMDLHPLNVMLGPKGAVVIDWANAAVGDPSVDVGIAWVLMAAGRIPGYRVVELLLGWFRSLLVDGFLDPFDRAQIATLLHDIVAWKQTDPHMRADEVSAMWRTATRAAAPVRAPGTRAGRAGARLRPGPEGGAP